jgi:hypothetical protein
MRLAAKSSSQAATFRRKEKMNDEGAKGTQEDLYRHGLLSLGVLDC